MLSRTDIEVLALAYEVECERNGGDWRLRSVPGQEHVNGKPPSAVSAAHEKKEGREEEKMAVNGDGTSVDSITKDLDKATLEGNATTMEKREPQESGQSNVESDSKSGNASTEKSGSQESDQNDDGFDSDGGWITPSNLKKRQIRDEPILSTVPEPKLMQVATITTDFAVSISGLKCH